MSVETLYENEWLSLKKVVEPARGVKGYVFSHETRCQGLIVAVLPYRRTDEGYEYLIKSEVTPCWSMWPVQSALTGGYEGKDVADDARRELEEESGYVVDVSQLISLGESYASKSSDTRYSLFTVDLTNVVPKKPEGDGSILELTAESLWRKEEGLYEVMDPQVHVMLNRIRTLLP